ncbi:MAG: tail-specific protease, partial [Bacteroidota bacterium]
MKVKIIVSSTIAAALLLLSSYTLLDGGEEKSQAILRTMINGMKYYHYQPQRINDDFSHNVYGQYLKRLDFNKRFFTVRDIQNLSKYEFRLDDEIEQQSYEMFDLSMNIFEQRVKEAETYMEEILTEPFDFDKDEVMKLDPEKMEYADDEQAVEERWRQLLKYQTLSRLNAALKRQEKAKNEGDEKIEIKSFTELEAEARGKVLKNNRRYFASIKKRDRNDRVSDYMNAILNIYDPHTGYYPPKDKENFDISISGQFQGIGAQLQETEEGYIKVIRIIPGSACYRQGDLAVGDL